MAQPPGYPNSQDKRTDKGMFCLFGCLAMIVIVVLAFAGVSVGIYYFSTYMIDRYTEETPKELPQVELSSEEVEAITTRIQPLLDALKDDALAATVTLTAEEINTLLQSIPEFTKFSKMAYVYIEDGTVRGDLSIPMDWMSMEGSYINGTGIFRVGTDINGPYIYIAELGVGGDKFNEATLKGYGVANLLDPELNTSPKAQKLIRRVSNLSVEDNKITISIEGV